MKRGSWGVVLSKPHSPFLYFPKYLFLSRNFLENQKRPFTPWQHSLSGLKIFQNFKNRILPPWVMSSLSSCRNLLAYHSYSKIFPGNETGDIPHGCLHIWDGCPIFAVVIFSFSSYFGTIIFDFRIIGWV